MVVFGKKRLYWAKVVVLVQGACIRVKWLFSGKSGLFGQSCCIQAKWLYSGISGCNPEK